MSELLPCPFCGSHGDVFFKAAPTSVTGFWWTVNCNDRCLSSGPMEVTEEKAIASWNRRATPQAHEPNGAGEPKGTWSEGGKEWTPDVEDSRTYFPHFKGTQPVQEMHELEVTDEMVERAAKAEYRRVMFPTIMSEKREEVLEQNWRFYEADARRYLKAALKGDQDGE